LELLIRCEKAKTHTTHVVVVVDVVVVVVVNGKRFDEGP
jgi:hypothetical protein